MSRGKIWLPALLLAVGLICLAAFYLWRDLNLPMNAVFEKLPDVVVENLSFRRDIDGREWRVAAKTAEYEDSYVRASSIDLSIRDESADRRTDLTAVSGDFSQDSSDVTLHAIDGVVFLPESSVDMTAPLARYDSEAGSWLFPEGIEVWDERTYLTGDAAVVTPEGIFTVERGAKILWDIK